MKNIALIVSLAWSSTALAIEYSCPDVLPAIKNGSAGEWMTYTELLRETTAGATPRFDSAGLRKGIPPSVAHVMPDNGSQQGEYWMWGLFWGGSNSYKLFASCSYKGSNIVLLKELPRNLSLCKVSRRPDSKARTISCR